MVLTTHVRPMLGRAQRAQGGRRGGRLRTALAAMSTTAVLVVAPVASVQAATDDPIAHDSMGNRVDLRIRASVCSGRFGWHGANSSSPSPSPYWARGLVKHCAVKYRMLDNDPNYDYWMMQLESTYEFTAGYRNVAAKATQYVYSDRSASGNVYAATKGYTGSTRCADRLNVGLSVAIGIFSVAVKPKVCKDYKVVAGSVSRSGAGWYAPKVAGVPQMRTVYYQKVKQGTEPRFRAVFIRPQYTHTWVANLYYKEKVGYSTWSRYL